MSLQMTSSSRISHRPLRSAAAVFAGLVTVAVLSTGTDAVMHSTGVFPPLDQPQGTGTFVIALAYRTAFTVAAGYLTAWLAPSKKLAHAMWLGSIGMLLGILGAVTMWNLGDQWYPIALVALAIPSTWLGGWLRVNR